MFAANAAAWIWAWIAFSDRPVLLRTASLAWVFGLRHAIDADHIAAIDNVVRKLMHEGKRPLGVGFFFSLGHSTVVVLASAAIAATAAALQDQLEWFKTIGAVVGTLVSAMFLLPIALTNLVILGGVWRSFRQVAQGGKFHPENLDLLLAGRGLLARLFRPLFRAVRSSWSMYSLGFLFGLGFDTATEIGLLGISAAQGAQGCHPGSPLFFRPCSPQEWHWSTRRTAYDDGCLRLGFQPPNSQALVQSTITAGSVLVALLIGGIEALDLLAGQLGLEGRAWSVVSSLNKDLAGSRLRGDRKFSSRLGYLGLDLSLERLRLPSRRHAAKFGRVRRCETGAVPCPSDCWPLRPS